jgi:DNA adenine methylase
MGEIKSPNVARPVLKWAGGKSQLLPELTQRIPSEFSAYHEPFAGGAALFFELANQGRLSDSYLSDINFALIDVYVALRDCVDDVIAILKKHVHSEDHYYSVRATKPEALSLPERAARIIYLNKTCYNGLYRENRSGQINVPFGRYKNPTICDEPNLRAAAKAFQGCHLDSRHFSTVLTTARAGDFVYFDPPYHPISTTSNFTSYAKSGFDLEDQTDLRDVFSELTRRGIKAMLSNSNTPRVQELYAEYRVELVLASRMINSKATSRGKILEVIVTNYDQTGDILRSKTPRVRKRDVRALAR